jgi:hypothetical protein
MKKIVGALVAGLILFSSNIALADGNDLLSWCSSALLPMEEKVKLSGADHIGIGLCLGFMQGITTANMTYHAMTGKEVLFCLPDEGISNEQAARIVVKYLKDHPEKLHEMEAFIAFDAFRKTFPCK